MRYLSCDGFGGLGKTVPARTMFIVKPYNILRGGYFDINTPYIYSMHRTTVDVVHGCIRVKRRTGSSMYLFSFSTHTGERRKNASVHLLDEPTKQRTDREGSLGDISLFCCSFLFCASFFFFRAGTA